MYAVEIFHGININKKQRFRTKQNICFIWEKEDILPGFDRILLVNRMQYDHS